MISDLTLAQLCLTIYGLPGQPPFVWDHFDDGKDSDGICWGIKRFPEADVIALRGSVTLLDWLRDLDVWANPFGHRDLRRVHPGFQLGMPQVWEEAKPMVGSRPVIVTGHSLGAGRASILAGIMTLDGKAPFARVVFGEPRPGYPDFCAIIADVPGRSYVNRDDHGHDRVTDLPYWLPPLDYMHPSPLISVRAAPSEEATGLLGLFRYHHMPLYVQALGALTAA